MCFVYLAPENTSLRLNRNMTRGSHHEPFMLVEADTDAIVAPDIDNETAVNVGMYMYYSWTRTRIYTCGIHLYYFKNYFFKCCTKHRVANLYR